MEMKSLEKKYYKTKSDKILLEVQRRIKALEELKSELERRNKINVLGLLEQGELETLKSIQKFILD